MIDTHVHLYDQVFNADRHEVVSRAREAGVRCSILPAIDKSTYQAQQDCLKQYPDFCHKAAGLHPTAVREDYREELGFAFHNTGGAVAIGEIGLDAYWSRDFLELQILAFEEQIGWARDLDLPLIIHSRSSFPELLRSLKRCSSPYMRGVLHAWSGSGEIFREANRYGRFMMGIGGVVTFRNARLAETVRNTDLTDIVLETDAPWLSPVPFRGKRNESSYLTYIAEKIAQEKQISMEKVVSQTTQNALSLFFNKKT